VLHQGLAHFTVKIALVKALKSSLMFSSLFSFFAIDKQKENRLAKISTAGFFIEIDDYIVVAKLLKSWF
jgi:hypothetical protein